MSSQDQDIIDKVFTAGYSLFSKGNTTIADVADRVITTVKQVSEKTGIDQASIVENNRKLAENYFSGGRSSWFRFQRKNLLFGIGLTASAVILFWQCKHLLEIPQRLPQSEKKCVLVLGDMHDPIIRSQVMDLYRRRFVVFVCSKNAKKYRDHEEEDDFLHHVDPTSSTDLAEFVGYLSKSSENHYKLASILFMPNLAYYPTGEVSLTQLESEIYSNALLYYSTLLKLLPHLQNQVAQLVLFNPSLSYNIGVAHHPVEIFISGFITSIHQSLRKHRKLIVYMIHLGILQLAAQPSNYKYLKKSGSNINESLLVPVYKLIMTHNRNWIVSIWQRIKTFGSLSHHLYCGRFSFMSKLPIFSLFVEK